MRIEDHYSRALPSANLRSVERTNLAALDLITANGMVHEGRFAAAALRFTCGDRSSAEALRRLCRMKLIGRSYHHYKDKLHPKDAEKIAEAVLTFIIDPRCPRCLGRKFVKLEFAPLLSAAECPECRGSGDRPRPTGIALWLLDECERESRIQSASLAKRLRVDSRSV